MSLWLLVVLGTFMCAMIGAAVLENWRGHIVRGAAAPPAPTTDVSITLIIPVRNGASTIVPLLQDLYAQRYPKEHCTTLVVDDGSTDGTARLVEGLMRQWPQLRLLKAEGMGKKAAIAQGVHEAEGELILLTDADARCGPDRVATLAAFWSHGRPDIVLLPVRTAADSSALGRLQAEEQNALQAATAGSALEGAPVLANGANLAFARQAFLAVGGYSGDRWASGDDLFLLDRMRRARKTIGYLLASSAVVTVEAEPTWTGFFAQRLRWAGKMRARRGLPGMVAGVFAVLFPWLLGVVTGLVVRNVQVGEGLFYTALLLVAAWAAWLFPILRLAGTMRAFFAEAPSDAVSGIARVPGIAVAQTTLALLAFTLYAPLCALLAVFVRPRWKGRKV